MFKLRLDIYILGVTWTTLLTHPKHVHHLDTSLSTQYTDYIFPKLHIQSRTV